MKHAAFYIVLMLVLPMTAISSDRSSKPEMAASHQPDGKKDKPSARSRALPLAVEPRPAALPPPPAALTTPHPAPSVAAPVKPAMPTPVTGCNPGGCRDADGNRYNGANGNTYLDKSGKPCNRTGTWVQCF